MRIVIVNSFFLPVPPVSGGSTEKSWYNLGREFAARGHEVVSLSRHWRGFPDAETTDGVHYRRLHGHDHQRELWRNLYEDFWWSFRVFRQLPPADILVSNALFLPIYVNRLRPRTGRVVVMPGRMPKGQYRRYHRIARILAPSSLVAQRVIEENAALAPLIRVTGYPINWQLLQEVAPAAHPAIPPRQDEQEVTLGFIGRIHEEKGLMLLAEALKIVAATPGLPPWRLILCGPSDVLRGGSGTTFRNRLLNVLSQSLRSTNIHLLDPQFNERALATLYKRLDLFCYPSLAEQGETFGVAVAEAMAAGAVPIVSNLACFRDFVRDGENGLVFDHAAPDAAARLAQALVRGIQNRAERQRMTQTARTESRRFDFSVYAEALLADFTALAGPNPVHTVV